MAATTKVIENFEDFVNGYKIGETGRSLKQIIGDVERVRQATPSVYHQRHIENFLENRVKVLNNLLDEYIRLSIGEKYSLLDKSIFSLKRYLSFKFVDKKVIKDDTEYFSAEGGSQLATIKLLVVSPLQVEKVSVAKFEIKNGYDKHKIELKVQVPGISARNLYKTYRMALSESYNLVSKILSTDGVGDILTENFAPIHPEILIMWIPTLDSMEVKYENISAPANHDPALLLKLRDNYFVLATWQTEDEMPLNQFLQEYAVGQSAST